MTNNRSNFISLISINVLRFLIVVLFLTIWQIIGGSSKDIFFFIGTPFSIGKEFIQLIFHENFHYHFFITGSEAVLGLLIGTVLGSSIGLLLWFSEKVTLLARPFIIAVGTLPVFAFAPLMIVWFGIDFKMKVVMAAFSTVFVAFNQANKGAHSVADKYIETLKGMRASNSQIFKMVIVPGSIDWVLSSMRLNVGFALLGAFIGEFISSNVGLGNLILKAGNLYNVPRAFAASIGIVSLALILDYLAHIIQRKRHKIIQFISISRLLWPK